jgi:serine/threonine protein kinase
MLSLGEKLHMAFGMGQCMRMLEAVSRGPCSNSCSLHVCSAAPSHKHLCRGAPRRGLGDKLRMALGVAQGMQALEAAEPPILHRDLKPSNVFINAVGRPCVADMGLARRLTPARCVAGELWTGIWPLFYKALHPWTLLLGEHQVSAWLAFALVLVAAG